MWDRVCGALHLGVKMALTFVQSGFVHDMNVVAEVIYELGKTDKENEAACLGLIDAAEEPRVDSPSSSSLMFLFLLMRSMTCEPNLGMKRPV